MKNNFAILRTAKIKSIGALKASLRHTYRVSETPNADKDKIGDNVHDVSIDEALDRHKDLLSGVKVRSNAVLAIEYLITYSPKALPTEAEQEKYFSNSKKWLEEKHGKANVLAVSIHRDETTPHMVAYVVPIDKAGKLNCREFLGGHEKMKQMQSDFADRVGRESNLQRGIEGSKASHTRIKNYYSQLQDITEPAPIKEKAISIPSTKTFGDRLRAVVGMETMREKALEKIVIDLSNSNKALQHSIASKDVQIKAIARQSDLNADRASKIEIVKRDTAQLREIPLKSVLEVLGAMPDSTDKQNYKTAVGRMTIDKTDPAKFYFHDIGRGGRGAIDLMAIHEDVPARQAIAMLARDFGINSASQDFALTKSKNFVKNVVDTEKIEYKLPEKSPDKWKIVRKYLIEKRGLYYENLDRLYEIGKIYADKFANVVFPLDGDKGHYLRGTTDKPFHGVRGEKTGFTLIPSDNINNVFIVESPIDAVSLSESKEYQSRGGGAIIATIGNAKKELIKEVETLASKGINVYSCQDNDKEGNLQAQQFKGSVRLPPPIGKDWNDTVKKRKEDRERVLEKSR